MVEHGGIAIARADPAGAEDDAPPLDPEAIDRAYWHHRARRRARNEHRRATKRAGARFWLILLILLAVTAAIVVFIAQEVQRLFGI